MQESFGSVLGRQDRRARNRDDDELDLHGYTTGTHEFRKRPIGTNADSHTEAREFGTPVDCQHRSMTADAPSGSAGATRVRTAVAAKIHTTLRPQYDRKRSSLPNGSQRVFPYMAGVFRPSQHFSTA